MSIFIVTNNRTFIIYSICEFPQARNRNVVNVMTDWYIYISFAIYYDMACVHCHRMLTLPLQCCHQVDSDLTPDLPQDAKGHQTCDRCLYPKLAPGRSRSCSALLHQLHHLHHMAGKVRPPETRTGRLHQGRKTATLHTHSSNIAVQHFCCYLCICAANCSKYI